MRIGIIYPLSIIFRFLGLIFIPEAIPEKALNIGDIRSLSSAISEQNLCPKNQENDQKKYKGCLRFFHGLLLE